MDIIIISILCLLAAAKVTLQGGFAKKNIRSFSDGVFFNGAIFFFSSFVFLKDALTVNLPTFLFGAAFGILSLIFQLCYIKAMSFGNVSITVLIVNLSMIIPIATSVLCFGEKLGVLRIIGILLTVVALVLNVSKGGKSTDFKKWLFLSLAASLANGGLAIILQLFGKSEWSDQNKAFVAWNYIVAAIVSFILYGILKLRGNGITFKLKPSVFGIALCVGIILGVFQALNAYAVSTIDGTLYFPTYNGGALVLSGIAGVLLLKDKFKLNQFISLLVGIVAIVLMNI